jgi:hypothetical protein
MLEIMLICDHVTNGLCAIQKIYKPPTILFSYFLLPQYYICTSIFMYHYFINILLLVYMMFRIIEYNFIIIIILLCETIEISGLYMFSRVRSKGTEAASGCSQVASGCSQVATGQPEIFHT